MIELTRKTRTAETRMGNHKDAIGTIVTSILTTFRRPHHIQSGDALTFEQRDASTAAGTGPSAGNLAILSGAAPPRAAPPRGKELARPPRRGCRHCPPNCAGAARPGGRAAGRRDEDPGPHPAR